jgi:hypothetical protein
LSLSLKAENRLRGVGNRMLRRIFGPKWDEMIGCWRKLRNYELHKIGSSPSLTRTIESRRIDGKGM